MTTEVKSSSLLHLAGSKLRHRLGGQLNESSAAGCDSAFAKKHLQKLGWKEGEGLGKRRQGMSSHIKVVKRAEGLGLGESTLDPAIQQAVAGQDWWKHSVGDTLAKLAASKNSSSSKKKKKNKKRDGTEKKRVYTDEELFEATGGARFGMRAQTQQHGKWKRAESNISEKEEDEAKSKVEWDGMSAPVVILTEKPKTANEEEEEESSKKKKKRKASDTTDEEKSSRDEVDRKRRKKEKKRQRKEASSESELSSRKSKKKSKKQKVSKDELLAISASSK
jgi:Pin2-interacting protein X1